MCGVVGEGRVVRPRAFELVASVCHVLRGGDAWVGGDRGFLGFFLVCFGWLWGWAQSLSCWAPAARRFYLAGPAKTPGGVLDNFFAQNAELHKKG